MMSPADEDDLVFDRMKSYYCSYDCMVMNQCSGTRNCPTCGRVCCPSDIDSDGHCEHCKYEDIGKDEE